MTHGSHWECIVDNVEKFFQSEFSEIINESIVIDEINEYGHNISSEEIRDNKIHSLLFPKDDYPIKIVSLIVNNELWSSYPVVNYGIEHEIIIENIIDEGNLIEGQISCRLKDNLDFKFTFFDPMYYKNKSKYIIGYSYSFNFNGFMYNCLENYYEGIGLTKEMEQKKNRINKEIFLDKDSTVFLSDEKGGIDDYKLISPILSVEKFKNIYSHNIYKIEIKLHNNKDFNIPVVVAEQNIKNDFIPKTGKSLNGSLWLCGVLNDEV